MIFDTTLLRNSAKFNVIDLSIKWPASPLEHPEYYGRRLRLHPLIDWILFRISSKIFCSCLPTQTYELALLFAFFSPLIARDKGSMRLDCVTLKMSGRMRYNSPLCGAARNTWWGSLKISSLSSCCITSKSRINHRQRGCRESKSPGIWMWS